jgi:Zn-dependent protease with chaperone function
LRLALLALPLAWWLALEAAWPGMESRAEQTLENLGMPGGYLTAILVPLAMLVYAVVVVGWYSRLLEHEADLEACLDDNGRFDPQCAADIRRALVRLLGRDRETWLASLLHPALGARLDVIERAGDPHYVRRFRQRMRWISAGVAALYAGSFLLAAA